MNNLSSPASPPLVLVSPEYQPKPQTERDQNCSPPKVKKQKKKTKKISNKAKSAIRGNIRQHSDEDN